MFWRLRSSVSANICRKRKSLERYENLSDEMIISGIRSGDTCGVDFLLEKYKNLVRKKARALYLIGGDNDDLIQEGMIGL